MTNLECAGAPPWEIALPAEAGTNADFGHQSKLVQSMVGGRVIEITSSGDWEKRHAEAKSVRKAVRLLLP